MSFRAIRLQMVRTFLATTMTLFVSAVLAVSSSSFVIASENFRGDDFSLSLPTGWSTIPKKDIDERMQAVSKLSGASYVDYDAGFQLQTRSLLEYPYVFIEKKNTSVTFDDFKSNYATLFEDAEQKTIDSYKTLYEATALHQRFFDDEKKALFMSMSVNTTSQEHLRGLTAIFFSKSGILQLSFYSKEGEFDTYLRDFDAIIDSLTYESA